MVRVSAWSSYELRPKRAQRIEYLASAHGHSPEGTRPSSTKEARRVHNSSASRFEATRVDPTAANIVDPAPRSATEALVGRFRALATSLSAS